MKLEKKYSSSYSAAGLVFRETEAVLHLLKDKNALTLLENEVKNNQFIQVNTEAARKRIVQEIIKRHEAVGAYFWEKYQDSNDQERKLCLFYAIIKVYKLIFDFHFDVTLNRWRSSDNEVDIYYYQMKLDEISGNNPDVDSWTDATKLKSITVYLRILREAGLLKENMLQKPNVDEQFWYYFVQINESWFMDACFVSLNQKKEIINNCR